MNVADKIALWLAERKLRTRSALSGPGTLASSTLLLGWVKQRLSVRTMNKRRLKQRLTTIESQRRFLLSWLQRAQDQPMH